MEHTKEPWRVVGYSEIVAKIGDAQYAGVASVLHNENDARRIVACVNACAGLDTEKLERQNADGVALWMFVQDLSRQKEYLMQQLKDERVAWSAKRTELLRNHDAEVARRKEAEQQRDELLAALKNARGQSCPPCNNNCNQGRDCPGQSKK